MELKKKDRVWFEGRGAGIYDRKRSYLPNHTEAMFDSESDVRIVDISRLVLHEIYGEGNGL